MGSFRHFDATKGTIVDQQADGDILIKDGLGKLANRFHGGHVQVDPFHRILDSSLLDSLKQEILAGTIPAACDQWGK